MSRRRSGEGSIYPIKDGYRGYVWCTNPDGTRYRKYVKGKTYEATQQAWMKLRDQAAHGPVSSDLPKLAEFLAYWLDEIVAPNLAPKTYEKYEAFTRLHIVPYLGSKRLDKLQVSKAASSSAHHGVRRFGAACACRGGRLAWILVGFAAVDPDSSVVPVSLQVSMVAEGFHGNRGLVPLSPRVRLFSSCPPRGERP